MAREVAINFTVQVLLWFKTRENTREREREREKKKKPTSAKKTRKQTSSQTVVKALSTLSVRSLYKP